MGRVEWPSQSTDSHANTVLDLSTFVRLRLDQTLQLSMFGLDLESRIDPCGPSSLLQSFGTGTLPQCRDNSNGFG